MPRVLNHHRDCIPAGAVWIMRPGRLGNRWIIGVNCKTRSEAIANFEIDAREDPALMGLIKACRGKDVVCCCAPKPCHGDVIVRLANAD